MNSIVNKMAHEAGLYTKCEVHSAVPFDQLLERFANLVAAHERDNTAKLYEELRSIIDGGSESFTHADAVQYLKDNLTSEQWAPEDMAHRPGGLAQPDHSEDSLDMVDWEAVAADQALTIALLRSEAIHQAVPQIPQEHSSSEHTGCVCQWDAEGDRVVTCERHQGWLEVVAEWADRAREAEKKIKALAQQDTDMTTHMTKTWFVNGQIVERVIPEAEIYKREWVGLTDEEIVLIVAECAASHQHTDIHFARAIEAQLRSKNT